MNAEQGKLHVIVGPMGSGKTAELITRTEQFTYSNGYRIGAFQPTSNTRDAEISSRTGMSIPAQKIDTVSDIEPSEFDVIAIDEAHMFDETDVEQNADAINRLRLNGLVAIVSAIDVSYKGTVTPIFAELYRRAPNEIARMTASCQADDCRSIEARNTGLFVNSQRQTSGDTIIPDVGKVAYKALCARHFWET